MLSARQAFGYAISVEILKLLAIVVIGWVLMTWAFVQLAQLADPDRLFRAAQIIPGLVALLGAALFYGGLLGGLYKVIHDANREART